MSPARIVVALAAAAGVVALVVAIRGAQRLPDGPQPLAWDREACAHCKMLIGEPATAAELVTRDGTVLGFDDPGCLITYLEEQRPAVHRIWLHHQREDRWLAPEQAGFIAAPSPMGFDLAVVARDVPGALSWDEARARVRARAQSDGGAGPARSGHAP